MDFTLLLDGPREPRKTIQIAKLGDDFEHSKYGQFSIAQDDIEAWKRNLTNLPGQRALIDEDHSADRTPRRTEASGWITDVRLEAGTPVADVEWTPKGEQAIRDGRYLFISPTFGDFTDERGKVHENTLIGAALTNRPFLSMPSLCLASEERVSEAVTDELTRLLEQATPATLTDELRGSLTKLLAAGPAPADSRGADMDTATLIKTLDLAADADEAKILETLSELKVGAEKAAKLEKKLGKNPVKTLEQQAADAGLVVLDATEVRTLQANALAGAEAQKQLHAQRFETAFELALKNPEGAKVTPAEHDSLKHFYTLDADATLKLIDERQPLVNAKPVGAATIELDATGELDDTQRNQIAKTGVLPDSVLLDQKIRKHMADKSLPESAYIKVLDQWQSGELHL